MNQYKKQPSKDRFDFLKDLSQRLPFFRFFEVLFRNLGKMIELNLLYMAFWLPMAAAFFMLSAKNASPAIWIAAAAFCMLPIGPATVGLVKILYSFTNEKPVFLFSDFMDAYKSNWKEAIIAVEFDFICFILIYAGLPYYLDRMLQDTLGAILFACMLLFTLTVLFMNFYLATMIAVLDLNFISKLKNSLFLALLGLKNDLLILFFCAVVVTPLVLFFPASAFFIVLIIPALLGLIIVFNSWPVIERYCVVKT